tara:strand:- start:326 stop:685 length:360 start_codon:yes stop_codon:yes gene_type:complete
MGKNCIEFSIHLDDNELELSGKQIEKAYSDMEFLAGLEPLQVFFRTYARSGEKIIFQNTEKRVTMNVESNDDGSTSVSYTARYYIPLGTGSPGEVAISRYTQLQVDKLIREQQLLIRSA